MRAQQERNRTIDRALDTPRMRSPRWAPPGSAGGTGAWARQPFGPPPPDEAPGAAAAAATGAAAGDALAAPAVAPELAAAADEVGTQSNTADAALERHKSALAHPTALPAEAAMQQQQEEAATQQQAQQAQQPDQQPPGAQAPAAMVEQHPQQAAGWASGRPDLATLSAAPSVPMERYEASLTRSSLVPGAGAGAGAGEPPGGSGEEGEGGNGSSRRSSARSGPPTPAATAASAHAAPLQLQRQYEPELLSSDLTATPSLDLSRYAAAFAADTAETPRGGAAELPFGQAPRRGVAFAEPEEVEAPQRPHTYEREASWHTRRSLAHLQSIFEHETEGGGEGGSVGSGSSPLGSPLSSSPSP